MSDSSDVNKYGLDEFSSPSDWSSPPTEQMPLIFPSPRDEFQGELSKKHASGHVFNAMLDAVEVMQSHYFAIWQGTWPTSIDWTAAVMGTQISATLSSISETLPHLRSDSQHHSGRMGKETVSRHENLINQYFTQVLSFYFGENAFSLRTQAYDDMLWVVLGWLESIKFINLHSRLHSHLFGSRSSPTPASASISHQNQPPRSSWYAHQFIPQFSHRARIFYDLASRGWETSLCGGGMVWNPYMAPYKNAITNQLYIAASVSMYLYFPGDDNSSPFSSDNSHKAAASEYENPATNRIPPAPAHNERYLTAAVTAYEWLKTSNMTNSQGLYADGFHITGWRGGKNSSHGTGKCDLREEKVYTYNQGVILSGLRGLWDATGKSTYLEDAHELIRNVLSATGWSTRHDPLLRNRWSGLGRGGVMEDSCDHSGTCNQNGVTFKGIFFHHLALFCKPLVTAKKDGLEYWPGAERSVPKLASADIAALHAQSCKGYGKWVEWNAKAAYTSRNKEGEYGTWWGWHSDEEKSEDNQEQGDGNHDVGTDYRNLGVPNDEIWRIKSSEESDENNNDSRSSAGQFPQQPKDSLRTQDVNDRGRGRTVETQSGGLAVIRALWDWRMWYRF